MRGRIEHRPASPATVGSCGVRLALPAGSQPSRGELGRPRRSASSRIRARIPAELAADRLGDRHHRVRRRAAAARRRARAGCGAAARRRRVRACSSRAAITASASRSGRPGTIGRASSGRSAASARTCAGGVAVAEGELLGGVVGELAGLERRRRHQVLGRCRHPERDVGGAAGKVAALALGEPVDGLLRHPPPGRQLAAGDRQHPRGGLVELRLARDVDRLLRIAGRDQRPHAGVGAGQVAAAEALAEVLVDGVEQVGRCRRRRAGPRRCRRRSRCRSCRSARARTRAGRRSSARSRRGRCRRRCSAAAAPAAGSHGCRGSARSAAPRSRRGSRRA